MVGVPLLPRCDLGAVAAHRLADLVVAQAPDHHRADQQRDRQRRARGEDAAQGQVLEYAETGFELGEVFGEKTSACETLAARSRRSASTDSMAAPREPFTRIVSLSASTAGSAAVSASRSANHCAVAPKAATADCSASPTPIKPRCQHHAPAAPSAACMAALALPSSSISPRISVLRPPSRREQLDGRAHGAGIGVVAVVDQHRAVRAGARRAAGAPAPGLQLLRPATMESMPRPAAVARAAAASALAMLWRPGSGRVSARDSPPMRSIECAAAQAQVADIAARDIARAPISRE
jgi:hypothetical protein